MNLEKINNRFSIGLAFFRVILAFLVMKNMIFYLPMASQLFGAQAIVSYHSYVASMQYFNLDFLIIPFDQPFVPQLVVMTIMILAALFLFGIGKQFTGIALYVLLFNLNQRNGFILDGSDNVIAVTLPFLIFSNCYQYFTWHNKAPEVKMQRSRFAIPASFQALFLIALVIQVSYIYFFTALHKLQGDVWLNGTATYYTMRVEEFRATAWNIPLTENHYFVVLSTYFTLFWEVAFAFLVWFRQTRYFILAMGVLLHVGIWVFMRIDNFSWIMIATYFFFVPNEDYRRVWAYVTRPRLVAFYDGYCPKCIRFMRTASFFDAFNNVRFASIREVQEPEAYNNLNVQQGIQYMATYDPDGETVVYGFESIYRIFKSIPLLYPAVPALWILKKTGIGDRLYQNLAINRKILMCDDKCELV